MRTIVCCLALAFTLDAAAITIDNDNSCDIAVLPAATLLLPYFEVDPDNITGETTLFTITNVTNVDQIAQVTLWTDHAFPVIVFPMYLTGYDVQSINLFDVIVRGAVAPTGTNRGSRGRYSSANPALNLTDCDRLPGLIPSLYIERMLDAFTGGFVKSLGNVVPACSNIGGVHENAVGYVTIDVVGACRPSYALDEEYWTQVIRYDNVLIGDYQQLNSVENSAQGGPLVHIRAIPEGGTPELRARLFHYDAEFDRTFYSRFQPAATPRLDGRQPLPAQFATRWIQGGRVRGLDVAQSVARGGDGTRLRMRHVRGERRARRPRGGGLRRGRERHRRPAHRAAGDVAHQRRRSGSLPADREQRGQRLDVPQSRSSHRQLRRAGVGHQLDARPRPLLRRHRRHGARQRLLRAGAPQRSHAPVRRADRPRAERQRQRRRRGLDAER